MNRSGGFFVCGVDEAGRGPLAGPVVAAAVILADGFDNTGIRDCKSLTPIQRAKQRERLIASGCFWGIGVVEAGVIDQINILKASFWAMKKAVEKIGVVPDLVLVDGKFKIPDLPIKQRAIISGDKLEFSISAASILAKTFRDDLMRNLAEEYPGYGFERHMGYPTKEHIANLKRLGPCPIHRKSFRPVSLIMNGLDR